MLNFADIPGIYARNGVRRGISTIRALEGNPATGVDGLLDIARAPHLHLAAGKQCKTFVEGDVQRDPHHRGIAQRRAGAHAEGGEAEFSKLALMERLSLRYSCCHAAWNSAAREVCPTEIKW